MLAMTFTCTAGAEKGNPTCGHRSTHEFKKRSYEKGVVIVQCPKCEARHLIADQLGWFNVSPRVWLGGRTLLRPSAAPCGPNTSISCVWDSPLTLGTGEHRGRQAAYHRGPHARQGRGDHKGPCRHERRHRVRSLADLGPRSSMRYPKGRGRSREALPPHHSLRPLPRPVLVFMNICIPIQHVSRGKRVFRCGKWLVPSIHFTLAQFI
jgi:hypothetical protein